MDVIWIINFEITREIEVTKRVLRPTSQTSCIGFVGHSHMFFQCDGIRLNSFFFTVNNQVIFLKCIFEFVFNTAQSALNGVAMLFFFHYLLFCFICLFVVQLLCFFIHIFSFACWLPFRYCYFWPLPSASQTECPSPWGRSY